MGNNQQMKNESLKDLWLGIFLTIGIYLLGLFIFPMIIQNLIGSIVVAGIIHIVTIVLSFAKGRKRLGQGLLIGLGVIILLMAACFGIIITSLGG